MKKKKEDLVLIWNEKERQFAVITLEIWLNSSKLAFVKGRNDSPCILLGIVQSNNEARKLAGELTVLRDRQHNGEGILATAE